MDAISDKDKFQRIPWIKLTPKINTYSSLGGVYKAALLNTRAINLGFELKSNANSIELRIFTDGIYKTLVEVDHLDLLDMFLAGIEYQRGSND